MTEEIVVRGGSRGEVLAVNELIPKFGVGDKISWEWESVEGRDPLVIIADIGGEPAGYMIGYDRDGDGSFYCWMTGVVPKHRRKGVFKSMMDYLTAWAGKKGYRRIKIKTRNCRREMLAYLVKNRFNATEVTEQPSIEDYFIHFERNI